MLAGLCFKGLPSSLLTEVLLSSRTAMGNLLMEGRQAQKTMTGAGRSGPGLDAAPARSASAVQATAGVKQTNAIALVKHLLVHPIVGGVC